MQSTDIIDKFLDKYNKDRTYYEELAEHVSTLCKELLNKDGEKEVQANVTYRAKATDRLRNKLQDRGKSYESEDQIRKDIVDLAGVRIALFFPSDKEHVNNIIEDKFSIVRKVTHPKPDRDKAQVQGSQTPADQGKHKRNVSFRESQVDDTALEYDQKFEGYQATHFWACFRDVDRPRKFKKNDKVEIQIMTVLQSAWSQVEHDILYKHLDGNPSHLERQMLDGLNGLVSIGEVYLNQLSTVRNSRLCSDDDRMKQFDNKYQLGVFLLSEIGKHRKPEEFTLSSVELLRKFLSLPCVGADTKDLFEKELRDLRLDTEWGLPFNVPYEEKANVSLIVMKRIYSDPRRGLLGSARNYRPESTQKMCQILVSTIISLDELFPPLSTWESELTRRGRREPSAAQSETLKNLKWLIGSQTPKNVILGDHVQFEPSERDTILALWRWFSGHESEIVQFVFGISKLGVERSLPQDLETLERICSVLQGCL